MDNAQKVNNNVDIILSLIATELKLSEAISVDLDKMVIMYSLKYQVKMGLMAELRRE
jgi:hypothetical protein